MALEKYASLSKGEQLRINAHILQLFHTDGARHEFHMGGFINDFRKGMQSLPDTMAPQQRFQITLDVLRENLASQVGGLPPVKSQSITEDLIQSKATLRQIGEYISSETRTDPRLKAKPAYYSPQQYHAITDPFFKAAEKHGSNLHPQGLIPLEIIGPIRDNWRAEENTVENMQEQLPAAPVKSATAEPRTR